MNGDGFDDVVVGAPSGARYYIPGERGRAVLYLGSALGLSSAPAWDEQSPDTEDGFGTMVASAGDVDGDGFDDVLVGAPLHGRSDTGKAYLYLGSAAGPRAAPSWTATEANTLRFGGWVASVGDPNGDGYDDVAVGAGTSVFVYLGGPAGLSAAPVWTTSGSMAGTAGDMNGDGFGELWVGDGGRVAVYLGGSPFTTPAWSSSSWSAASSLDVNGDGFGDLVTGEGLYMGSPWVGFPWNLSPTPLPAPGFWLGVVSAGDVNGDGSDDVVMGDGNISNPQTCEGAAWLTLGSAPGFAESAAWQGESDRGPFNGPYDRECVQYGSSVASAGDVNGDGLADVVIGAPGYPHAGGHPGAAFGYFGNSP